MFRHYPTQRGTLVIIQKPDGSLVRPVVCYEPGTTEKCSCYAELPLDAPEERASLIDQLIGFAFDTLGVRHFEMRVGRSDD
jgi:hypothetical protein